MQALKSEYETSAVMKVKQSERVATLEHERGSELELKAQPTLITEVKVLDPKVKLKKETSKQLNEDLKLQTISSPASVDHK